MEEIPVNDIVERLRYWAVSVRRNPSPLSDAIPMVTGAADEIESLRQKLVEKDAEIERLKYAAENPNFKGRFDTWQAVAGKYRGEAEDLTKQLASSQAREQQLRESIDNFGHGKYCSRGIAFVFNKNTNAECTCQMRAALSTPTDTTALQAYVARAGEVMRERCAAATAMMYCEGVMSLEDAPQELRALTPITLKDLE